MTVARIAFLDYTVLSATLSVTLGAFNLPWIRHLDVSAVVRLSKGYLYLFADGLGLFWTAVRPLATASEELVEKASHSHSHAAMLGLFHALFAILVIELSLFLVL